MELPEPDLSGHEIRRRQGQLPERQVFPMAFDGFTTRALQKELSDKLTGARIYRIVQPESDELLLTLRPEASRGGGQVRLLLCADATLPLVYLTEQNKPAPNTAPTFCMLLRKYLQNGKIVSVTQPGLERILRFEVEHLNEMGDLCRHVLVIELMGKHSNIILLDARPSAAPGGCAPSAGEVPGSHALPGLAGESGAAAAERSETQGNVGPKSVSVSGSSEVILDSIKHISQMVSSVREVLPGRPYFIPETQGKINPFEETKAHFLSLLSTESLPASRFLLTHYNGFSTQMSEETVFRARLSQDRSVSELSSADADQFWETFRSLLADAGAGNFHPTVYYHLGAADAVSGGEPVEYSVLPLSMYRDLPEKHFDSISELIENYYREKNALTRIRQKSADLRKIVQTILERDLHKYDLQSRQMKDTDKREKYRIYGELLNTYGYTIPEGSSSAELDNYYTGEKITVPLDPSKTPLENAKRYFDRYTKLKRTREALETLMKEGRAEIDQLENIREALNLSVTEGDLAQIRAEMEASGFVRRHMEKGKGGRKGPAKIPEAQPLHFRSSDGYDIFVGKNNTQNDELTFHLAKPTDIWFHANDIPGSHVILRTEGTPFEQVPDRAFEEAARLAAYYSKGRDAGRVEVDYLEKKNVKKPSGARPGFVIYHTNYSILADADKKGLQEIT